MSAIPPSWVNATGGDLFEVVRGVSYDKADATSVPEGSLVPLLRANNIQNGKIVLSDLVYVPRRYVSDEQLLRTGDIVLAASSGSKSVVGKAARASVPPLKYAFGAFCAVARPRDRQIADWLNNFMGSQEYRRYVESVALGININNFRGSDLKALPIVVAPLGEQRRIAAKIDSLSAKTTRTRDHLDHVLRLVEKYKQAILAAAFDGRLSRSWALSRGLAKAWRQVAWKNAGETLNGRAFPSSAYSTTGVRLLRPGNLAPDGKLVWTDKNTRFMPPGFIDEAPRHHVRGPAILINLTAQSLDDQFLGRACLAEETDEFLLNQRIALFRPSCLHPKFCLYVLKSPRFRSFVDDGLNAGSLIQHVHTKQLERFVFEVPDPHEQDEIVRRIETAFAWINRLAAEVTSARKLLDQLDQAILAKAFRGELVPQDPADEPASVLLERIRAERAGAPTARRGRIRADAAA